MKTNTIIAITSVIVLSGIISGVIVLQTTQEHNLSKQCTIPNDINFIERRAYPTPNDGKPHYSIEEEFSIYYTVPIGYFEVDENFHSLILKPVPTSHGYVIMCDPLPILQKRFDAKMNSLIILLDNEEIEYKIINNVLKINVNNNTRIEIIAVTFV
jgi:hypothetical protein